MEALHKNKPQTDGLGYSNEHRNHDDMGFTDSKQKHIGRAPRSSLKTDFLAIDLDHIATSTLSPEQKINLMAAVCAEDCTDHEESINILKLSDSNPLIGRQTSYPLLSESHDGSEPIRSGGLSPEANRLTFTSRYSLQRQRSSDPLTVDNVQLQSSIKPPTRQRHLNGSLVVLIMSN